MQLWPSATLLSRPTFGGLWLQIVLRKDMSYGRTHFSGVHIFQDDMSYESIHIKGGHAL